jgi:methyl-accepting chemotaxis protein
MLKSLDRVFTRILILAALALCALGALGLFVINESRDNLYEQKKADIRHVVEAAVAIAADYDKRAAAGQMSAEQAQAEAKKIISGIRYEGQEYIFALDMNGVMIVHPTKPERVGKNLWDEKDPSGRLYIQDFIAAAKAGGNHVYYYFNPPKSTEWVKKVSYIGIYKPWGWAVGSGILIDDVETMHSRMVHKVLIGLGIIGVLLLLATVFVTRSIVKPLSRLTGSLQRIAGGDIQAPVEGVKRRDEFGTIARAVIDVRDAIGRQSAERMHQDEEAKARSDGERRKLLSELSNSLDVQVKAIAESVETSARDLVETARSMQSVSESARHEADDASRASKVTAERVATVGTASEQLDGSINEISARVHESSQIAQEAVVQTREAHNIVRTLSNASAEIGKVVSLIQAIAAQTNLLALNATIEAARAGESGKGFAVVATEVKTLASQTAQATEEIANRINTVVEATEKAVSAIDNVDKTIGRINEIASTIAAAVEEQGAATSEIARAVGQTTQETGTLSASLSRLLDAANATTQNSTTVVTSADGLSDQAAALKRQVNDFVARIAAA